MNHAADDPLPPFTSQKAALLTTKIAAKSRLLPLPAQASGGGYPAADEGAGGRAGKGRGLEHEEELRTTTKDEDFLTSSSLKRQETLFLSPLPTCTSSSCYK
jgi:hypothetical protein